jgi:hypothetical protein
VEEVIFILGSNILYSKNIPIFAERTYSILYSVQWMREEFYPQSTPELERPLYGIHSIIQKLAQTGEGGW